MAPEALSALSGLFLVNKTSFVRPDMKTKLPCNMDHNNFALSLTNKQSCLKDFDTKWIADCKSCDNSPWV